MFCPRTLTGHEEVEAGSGDEGSDKADQVVVHVARVPEGCRARGHDRRYQLIYLHGERVKLCITRGWNCD